MPRQQPERDQHYSLSQIMQQVQEVLEYNFPEACWVVAEVGQIQRNRHCYLTLTETNSQGLVAQVRATIWHYQSRMLDEFEEETGQTLKAGMKVLVFAKISFHATYGLSLQITELDAGFTLGELALRKKRILDQLTREGLLHLNKQRTLPLLPQRIAIISSATAAGYEDFVNQLLGNVYGHRAYVKLFPAVMQGEGAEAAVALSLRRITAVHTHFDAIVIIRGGGSSLDLECFNSYTIARAIANSPLPVITGIGHLRDETITDLVSFAAHKTPTAVAEFLIGQLSQFLLEVEDLAHQVNVLATDWLSGQKHDLLALQNTFERQARQKLQNGLNGLNRLQHSFQQMSTRITTCEREKLLVNHVHLNYAVKTKLATAQSCLAAIGTSIAATPARVIEPRNQLLHQLTQLIQAYDPQVLLKRGYSITFSNGQVVKDAANLDPEALLFTQLANGGIVSQVVNNRKPKAATQPKKKKKPTPNGTQLAIEL